MGNQTSSPETTSPQKKHMLDDLQDIPYTITPNNSPIVHIDSPTSPEQFVLEDINSEKIEDIQVEGITSNPPLPDYRPKRREAGTNIDDLK